MARNTLETQQKRLRLKAEELKLRVQAQDQKTKLREVRMQLKSIGGRVR
jgi:hypothetical protein